MLKILIHNLQECNLDPFSFTAKRKGISIPPTQQYGSGTKAAKNKSNPDALLASTLAKEAKKVQCTELKITDFCLTITEVDKTVSVATVLSLLILPDTIFFPKIRIGSINNFIIAILLTKKYCRLLDKIWILRLFRVCQFTPPRSHYN